MKTKIFFIIPFLLQLFGINENLSSQINPSVYTGWGFGTNLGGEVGIGSEFKYKMMSVNAAMGSWIGEFPAHTGAKSRFDYDFGVKIYSRLGLFLGVNYGIIDESLYTKTGQSIMNFEKTHGFSFTGGYRHTIYKNIYGLGYFGITSNKKSNYIYIFDEKDFVPRIGLIIGYEFINYNKNDNK